MGSYFGDYFACILETGEMPSLGGKGAVQGICDTEFKPFSLSAGRPRVNLSSSQRGALTNSNRGALTSRGRPLGSQPFISNGGTFNGEAIGRNSNPGRPLSQQLNQNNSSVNGVGSGGGSSEGTDSGAVSIRRGGGYQGRRLYQSAEHLEEKVPPALRKPTSIVKKSSQAKDLEQQRSVRVSFDPQKLQKKPEEIPLEASFTFENFLKFILIAAIVVIIVIFFGGQAMMIKKGWEK